MSQFFGTPDFSCPIEQIKFLSASFSFDQPLLNGDTHSSHEIFIGESHSPNPKILRYMNEGSRMCKLFAIFRNTMRHSYPTWHQQHPTLPGSTRGVPSDCLFRLLACPSHTWHPHHRTGDRDFILLSHSGARDSVSGWQPSGSGAANRERRISEYTANPVLH